MESGAKGVEVVVSGKLRAARAKAMKFTDGFMIHSGQPARDFVDHATRHVLMRQGVLGIKVKIMKPWDPEGRTGPSKPLPDMVTSTFSFTSSPLSAFWTNETELVFRTRSVSEPKADAELSQSVQSINVGAVNVPAPAAEASQEAPAQEVATGNAEVAAGMSHLAPSFPFKGTDVLDTFSQRVLSK